MFVPKYALLFPLALVMALDLALTMRGQPESYWYDYTQCVESCPIGHLVLTLGPWYFVIGYIFYMTSTIILVKSLPKPYNISLAIFIFLAHSSCGSSWLAKIFKQIFAYEVNQWYLQMFYFICIAAFCGFCSRRKPAVKSP